MRKLLRILVAAIAVAAAALLCGCNKPVRWEYRMEEITTDADEVMAAAYKKTPVDYEAITYDEETASSFDLTKNQERLASLGADGWELVSATPMLRTTYPEAKGQPFTRTEKTLLIFKRPAR